MNRTNADRKFHFTKRRIEGLPLPDKKQIYYSDSETKGLEVSIGSKGSRSFVYRRKVDGVSRRLRLGSVSDLTVEQARTKASELNARFGSGENIFDTAGAIKDELTLTDLFETYLERHAKKSKKTWKVMAQDFERNAATLKGKRLSTITSTMAEKLHTDLT